MLVVAIAVELIVYINVVETVTPIVFQVKNMDQDTAQHAVIRVLSIVLKAHVTRHVIHL